MNCIRQYPVSKKKTQVTFNLSFLNELNKEKTGTLRVFIDNLTVSPSINNVVFSTCVPN